MARQNYGMTPWGAWFIEVLDSWQSAIPQGERLSRGRSYANTGKVASLTITGGTLTPATVSAKVAGHYAPWYKVEIEFPPLDAENSEKIQKILADNPAFCASLAAGSLPGEFFDALHADNIPLIPRHWREMKRRCTCPDEGGDPCKHVAAVYYMLAREIDSDSRILFRLRGIDLAALAAKFGAAFAEKMSAGDLLAIDAPFALVPLEAEEEQSEKPEFPSEAPIFPEIPHCADLVLSLLPSNPPFGQLGGRDFAVVFAEFYHKMAREALLLDKTRENDDDEEIFSRSHWRLVNFQGDFSAIVHEKVMLERSTLDGFTEKIPLSRAFERFFAFSRDEGTESYRFFFHLFKLIGLLIENCAFIPAPVVSEDKKSKEKTAELSVLWLPWTRLPPIERAFSALEPYEWHFLAFPAEKIGKKGKKEEKTLKFARSATVLNLVAAATLTSWVRNAHFSSSSGGSAFFHQLSSTFFENGSLDVSAPATRSLPRALYNWLTVLRTDFSAFRYRLY